MSKFLQEKPHKALIETIKEYLEQHGYRETLTILEVIIKQKEQVPDDSSALSELLFSMDKGDSHSFFVI